MKRSNLLSERSRLFYIRTVHVEPILCDLRQLRSITRLSRVNWERGNAFSLVKTFHFAQISSNRLLFSWYSVSAFVQLLFLLVHSVLIELLFDLSNHFSVVFFCVARGLWSTEMSLCFFLHNNVQNFVLWQPNLSSFSFQFCKNLLLNKFA